MHDFISWTSQLAEVSIFIARLSNQMTKETSVQDKCDNPMVRKNKDLIYGLFILNLPKYKDLLLYS